MFLTNPMSREIYYTDSAPQSLAYTNRFHTKALKWIKLQQFSKGVFTLNFFFPDSNIICYDPTGVY